KNSVLKDSVKSFKGFRYYNLPYPAGASGWISYRTRYREVAELMKNESLHAIIGYGSPTIMLFNTLLRKWSKERKIVYLADCVDWLSASNGSIVHRIVKSLDDYQKRVFNSNTDGVIA